MRKWILSALRKELGTQSCLCGLVVIVGVNEKGVISKGTGGYSVSSFFGKNSKEARFRTCQLNFSHNLVTIRKNLRLQHSISHSVLISTHKAQFVTFYSLPWTITYQIVWSFETLSHYSVLFSSSKPIHSIELPLPGKKLGRRHEILTAAQVCIVHYTGGFRPSDKQWGRGGGVFYLW